MALGRRHGGGHRGGGGRGYRGFYPYPYYQPLTYIVDPTDTYCPIHDDQCAASCMYRKPTVRLAGVPNAGLGSYHVLSWGKSLAWLAIGLGVTWLVFRKK